MDILYLVDRLENLVGSSRRMPVVNQIMLKEADILNIIDQMRTSVPEEIKQARRIIQEKERILAQAQADSSALLTRAREETERAMNREGLLRAAEARSQELVRQAEEQAKAIVRRAEEHNEQMKNDADSYVAETLHNLKDHLNSIEMDIDRSILSIDKGLESLGIVEDEAFENEQLDSVFDEDEREIEDTGKLPASAHPLPRRSSLANDGSNGALFS